MVVENSVLMKVVFPNPDSPATCFCQRFQPARIRGEWEPTMIVKAAPRFATILCLVHQSDLRFPPFTSTAGGARKHTAGWGAKATVIVSNSHLNDTRDRKMAVSWKKLMTYIGNANRRGGFSCRGHGYVGLALECSSKTEAAAASRGVQPGRGS